jgi:hypothetical protein
MKKKPASNILTLLAGLCLLAGTAGCFSVDSAVGGVSGEEYVVVRNYGWKAFKFIPLVSGNATENAWFPWAVLRDDITMDKIQKRFMDHAGKRGKTPVNLKYTDYDTVMFNLPLVQYPLPIPYLLCYREIQLSGTLK